MKNKVIFQLLFSGALLILLASCASITGFQTGRTVGADTGEIMFSVNGTQSPDFDKLDSQKDSVNTGSFSIFAPNIEIGTRYGINDKVDFGIRANTNLNIFADAKVQVVGDQESPFAMALGAGIGMFGFVSTAGGLFNFQIPVYTSYHPTDNFAVYLAPRYIGQWGTTFGHSSGLLNYFGANVGFLTGRKTKFGVDIAYYGLNNGDTGYNDRLFQIGFGMKFKIGGNEK